MTDPISFIFNPINRMSEWREGDEQLIAMRHAENARAFLMAGEKIYHKKENFKFKLVSEDEAFFLGLPPNETGGLFVVNVPDNQHETMAQMGFEVSDLRTLAMEKRVDEATLGALGQAKSLLYWHKRYQFCGVCGAKNSPERWGWQLRCKGCNTEHFPRTDPVVIMLPTFEDKCVLGRQSRFPPGVYSALAGFLEPGETIETAVARETNEEVGLKTNTVRIIANQPWPFPASLMIGCISEVNFETLTVDSKELEDARWFTRDECRKMLAATHEQGFKAPGHIAIARLLLEKFVQGSN
jgi:NAD+ diphosphatase